VNVACTARDELFHHTTTESFGNAPPYGGIAIGMHGPVTHVWIMLHTACGFICRARPPHAPLMPVVQQLRPEAQSLLVAQLPPTACFATVAVAVALAVADAVAVTVAVTVAVAVAVVDATAGVLDDAVGSIVTDDADWP